MCDVSVTAMCVMSVCVCVCVCGVWCGVCVCVCVSVCVVHPVAEVNTLGEFALGVGRMHISLAAFCGS